MLQSCVPSRGSKGECLLAFPPSRGRLHALVSGPRPANASLPSLIFCFWLSGLRLSLKKTPVIGLDPPGLSRIISPIWRWLIWSHLQSPLGRVKYHIRWFWGLDVDMGWGEGDGSAPLFTTLFWKFWGGPVRVESGCLPEDSLLIRVSKPSLFITTRFHSRVSWLVILSYFISPCLWRYIVEDKTQRFFQSETRALHLACMKEK